MDRSASLLLSLAPFHGIESEAGLGPFLPRCSQNIVQVPEVFGTKQVLTIQRFALRIHSVYVFVSGWTRPLLHSKEAEALFSVGNETYTMPVVGRWISNSPASNQTIKFTCLSVAVAALVGVISAPWMPPLQRQVRLSWLPSRGLTWLWLTLTVRYTAKTPANGTVSVSG